MSLRFNIPKYFEEQGLRWDTVQALLGWPKGQRRHALKRFVEGTGRLSRGEIDDLLRYVYDHCPMWLDYMISPNVLQLMSEAGRVRVYVVGGTQGDESRDHSSMFDLLALSHVNAHLPRTTWRQVRFDIEPCRMSWVRRGTPRPDLPSIDSTDPPEWKISFGSSKVSWPTTLLLERIYGSEAARPPAADPIVFRLRASPDRPLVQSRFVEELPEEHQQGISIGGGKPFLYVPPGQSGLPRRGTDIGLVVSQANSSGAGGRVVVAGVSGPGTYAAAIALVERADLFASKRAAATPAHGPNTATFDPEPVVGVVEATVEQEEGATAAGRIVIGARLVYCSSRPDVSVDTPISLHVPQ
jgi:hypothetical protein